MSVKLGTITPDGADVYSYDEDDLVVDPNLEKHLAHFGLSTNQMEKVIPLYIIIIYNKFRLMQMI